MEHPPQQVTAVLLPRAALAAVPMVPVAALVEAIKILEAALEAAGLLVLQTKIVALDRDLVLVIPEIPAMEATETTTMEKIQVRVT